RVWFDAEYLLWWIKESTVPSAIGAVPTILVTQNQNLPPSAINPLFGGLDRLDYFSQSGLRLSAGVWLDDARDWGVEASAFQLEKKNHDYDTRSGGDPVLGPLF